ncbi:MAG: helix-turn-helix domain-containing protein [Caldilineaceae bacterium]
MAKEDRRSYQSPMRQQRADETRARIVEAARTLFLQQGYDQTTVDAVATEAGVATQTVYGAFRSKRGLLAAILDRARFGQRYQELIRQSHAVTEPVARLRLIAQIATQILSAEEAEATLLRGAGVVAPELAKMGRTVERHRLEVHEKNVQLLMAGGRLRPELDAAKAQDILWALTGRELYTMLVVERHWSPSAYEQWLAQLLIRTLLTDHAEEEVSL